MNHHLDQKNANNAVNTNGGAHNNSVTVGLNPIVALSVGKYALNDNATTCAVSANESHHTFQSVTAKYNPLCAPSVCASSPTPTSSSIRRIASARSWGVSHEVVAGKSGSMNIAMTANNTVSAPSM